MGSNYWQKRFEFLENQRNKIAIDTVQSITPAFNEAQAKIEKEINAWYGRFAKNNEISLQEAKKLLNTKELKEFRWDVQEYIKFGRQNAIDQKWMKELENASARFHISRLEALKIRTQNAAEQAFGNELDALDEMVARIYMDDYYHTAYEIQKGLGVGFDVSKIDQRKLDSIVSKPWTTDKMTFSDRIWKAKTQLLDSLHTELTQMCILGKEPDEVIRNISQRMNVSKGQAGRLVMTEAAYFGSVAQKDCFNDLDVEKYEVIATLDNRTSEVCRKMDGQVFDMKDYQAGVTAPPFHCWCRSCTAPWFEDNDDGTRVARDADGKTYEVPASMKYEDWKKTFVEDSMKSSDKKSYLKFLNILGKNTLSVEKFIDIKYNINEWALFQRYAYAIKSGELTPLADFALYKETSNKMDDLLVGITTSNGIKITGKSNHSIARVIGSVEQRRNGVSIDDLLDALTNNESEILPIKNMSNGRSQKFRNKIVEVSVNPDDGNIIQVNPVHSGRKAKS